LVRDGKIEGTDPPPVELDGAPPRPIEADGSAPTGAADHGRSDEANRQGLHEADRNGTMAFDTMARPPLWPGPGAEADCDSPNKSKRRMRAPWFIVLGVFAIVGGNFLIKTPSFPTHRFVPSRADLAVVHKGGTAVPPICSVSAVNAAPGYGLGVAPGNANEQFTVYPDTVIGVFGNEETPEVSARAPVCQLDAEDSLETAYYVEGPGAVTVYFIDRAAHVSVVRIRVTSSSPPSTLPGWVLIVLGGLACISGVVLWYRRIGRHDPDDLRRADDAQREGPFDPQKAQRAAWDALDQSSGQW